MTAFIASLGCFLLIAALPAHAQLGTFTIESKSTGWITTANAEFGGDAVITVVFDDGDTQDVNAGQGISLSIGRYLRPNNGPMMYSGGLGFKYVTTAADNANIHLTRFVLDARVDRAISNGFWIGAGPVAHIGTKLNMDDLGPDLSFDPALGLNVRIGWQYLSLTYTLMSYKDEFGGTYDATAIGFSGHVAF